MSVSKIEHSRTIGVISNTVESLTVVMTLPQRHQGLVGIPQVVHAGVVWRNCLQCIALLFRVPCVFVLAGARGAA